MVACKIRLVGHEESAGCSDCGLGKSVLGVSGNETGLADAYMDDP